MNRFRKVLCVALVLLLLVASVPAVPVADLGFGITASALDANGSCGDNATYTFDSATGKLVISGTGPMTDYELGLDSPFYESEIKSLVVEDGITTIGENAFYNCDNLTSVVIGDSVTTIGEDAFYSCNKLENVELGNNIKTIASGAFIWCGLTDLIIPDSVITIGVSAFYSCSKLESVTIGNSVETIGDGAFEKCEIIHTINIPRSVTTIGDSAFRETAYVEDNYKTDVNYEGSEEEWNKIKIGRYNYNIEYSTINFLADGRGLVDKGDCGENVSWRLYTDGKLVISGTGPMYDFATSSSSPFSFNEEITSVEIEYGVTTTGRWSFYSCSNLEEIILPESIKTISYGCFEKCISLSGIDIPNSVTKIEAYAFFCAGLESVVIPGSVETIEYCTFRYNTSLKTVTIEEGVPYIADMFSMCTSLESVSIPLSVKSVSSSAFEKCLKDIYYAGDKASWDKINFKNYSEIENATIHFLRTNLTVVKTGKCGKTASWTLYDNGELVIEGTGKINAEAFYNNQDIKAVVIGDGITEIGADAFNNCDNLTTVDLSNTITVIGNKAFFDCDSLVGVAIPDSVITISDYAFCSCYNLANVDIGNGVITIGYNAFNDCDKLASVIIGESVTTIGDGAFYDCDNLMSVIIPDSVIAIVEHAFYGCDKLASVDIGNGVTTIGYRAFAYCYNLTSATVGNSVKTINWAAFNNCTSLESINIPKTVTYIGEEAFRYCPSLTDVYYEGAEENWNAIQIYENNTGLENAEIHFAETHTHTWDVEEITKQPTCTEKGEKTISCKGAVCKKVEELPMKEHECYRYNVKDVTCTEKGYIEYHCHYCDYSYFEYVEAPGHNFVDYYSNNDATCKEDGTKTATCNRCWGEKDTIVDEGSKDKVAHKFDNGKCTVCGAGCEHENWDLYGGYDATCTSEGFKEHYECKDCYQYLDSNKEIIDKNDLIISIIPHDVEGVEYTKYDDEYHSKKCNMCGVDVAYALHEYKDVISTVLPTCVTEGAETKMCVCGDTQTEALPMNDNHDWGAYKETLAATCTEKGTKEAACKREGCAEKDIQEIPALGHDMFVIESIVPTCQAEGNNRYYGCYRCDKYFKDAEGCIETTKAAETIAKGEHVFTKYAISKDATCTANAVEKATCDICWEATYERAIPGTMVAHLFKNYVSDGNATCIADGTMTAVCEICKMYKDTKTDVGSHKTAAHTPDAKGERCTLCGAELTCLHVYSAEKLITKTPTCTENGQKAIVCSKCKANKPGSEEVVPALGHDWDEGVVTKEPTCVNGGEMVHKCLRDCGETVTETIDKREHTYKEVITHATCTEAGYSTFTCTMCGSHYVDKPVEAYGHMFETYFYDAGSATCYQDGTKTAKCANGCGTKNTIIDPGSKTDHEMTDFTVITPATCTEDGEEEAKCFYHDKCGYSELIPVKALGHDFVYGKCTRCGDYEYGCNHIWGAWVIRTPVTCTESGFRERKCIRCAEISTEEIPALGHDLVEDSYYDPTCEESGFHWQYCSRCGEEVEKELPALGHDYEEVYEKQPTCTEDGYFEYACTRCGDWYSETVESYGHDFDYIEDFASCTEDGYYEYYCVICGYSESGVIEAYGHTYPDQWSVIIPATCKETGVAVKVCFDCHEVIAMVVPKAGHSDFDGDSKCDTCGGTITVVEPEKPAEKPEEKPCNCDCHAGGIKAFFFKLINFFAKIFDKNARVCDCGKAH